MYVSIISWTICWEACCCLWICSASVRNMPSHSACAPCAPSAARSIRLLTSLSTVYSLLDSALMSPCVPIEETLQPGSIRYEPEDLFSLPFSIAPHVGFLHLLRRDAGRYRHPQGAGECQSHRPGAGCPSEPPRGPGSR